MFSARYELGISDRYIFVLKRLRMRSEGNVPKKCRTKSCFQLHDNAPAQQLVLVKKFLTKINVTTLELSLPWLQLIFTCSLD